MTEMQVTEALLRAILELIEKCETLDELRASVKRIMGGAKIKSSGRPVKNAATPPKKVRREPYPGHLDSTIVRQKNQGGKQIYDDVRIH